MRHRWSGQSLHPPGRRPIHGDIEKGSDPRTPVQNLLRRLDDLPALFEIRAFRERFVVVAAAELRPSVQ